MADRMTPAGRLTVHEGAIGIDEAERVMVEHKVKKLPLVDGDGRLLGLITAWTSASTGDSRSPRGTRKAGYAWAPRSAPPATISSAPPS